MNFSLTDGTGKSSVPIIAANRISVKIADVVSEDRGSGGNKKAPKEDPSALHLCRFVLGRHYRRPENGNLLRACSPQAAAVSDRTSPCVDAANVALTFARTV